MANGNARRFIELGCSPQLGKELATQITTNVGNARRLMELGVMPREARIMAASVVSHTVNLNALVETSTIPAVGKEFAKQIADFTPNDLGVLLLAFWDAEVPSSMTLAGSSVTTWRDSKNGYAPTQPTPGSKPTYSANGLNNRPCVTFDGTDDSLDLAATPALLPVGAAPGEIWSLATQDALVADTSPRYLVDYGGVGNDRRRQARVVNTLNRPSTVSANGTTNFTSDNLSVDYSGAHVFRSIITATNIESRLDGTVGPVTAVVSATGTGNFRMGCQTSTNAGYWQGKVNALIFTGPLSAGQATQLTNYLKARGGIA